VVLPSLDKSRNETFPSAFNSSSQNLPALKGSTCSGKIANVIYLGNNLESIKSDIVSKGKLEKTHRETSRELASYVNEVSSKCSSINNKKLSKNSSSRYNSRKIRTIIKNMSNDSEM